MWRLATPAVLDWGVRLRAAHRWAVTTIAVDGRTRTLMWAPAAPLPAISPVVGAPNGVHLRADAERPTRLRLALGGGPLPAGDYELRLRLSTDATRAAQLSLGGSTATVAAGAPALLAAPLTHAGGPLTLAAELTVAPDAAPDAAADAAPDAAPDATRSTTVWASDVVIARR